jgi:protein-disulfide isomerase
MRICTSCFRHFTKPIFFSLLAGTVMTSLCVTTTTAQQAPPQQGEDPVALKNDLQQLKAQQQLILDRLDELKKLLNAKRGDNAQPQIKVPDTISVDGEFFQGEAAATVAIIEYGDIECPFCRHFKRDVFPKIFDEYIKTGKVRFYYRDMPLPFHEHAIPAAQAAHCAGEQGKFWEMHDSLFTDIAIGIGPSGRASALSSKDIDERATKLGLDTAKLDACMASNRFAGVIKRSSEEAAKMNIEGTPTFLIGTIAPNGSVVSMKKPVVGAQPFDAFKAVIDPLFAPAQPDRNKDLPLSGSTADHAGSNH